MDSLRFLYWGKILLDSRLEINLFPIVALFPVEVKLGGRGEFGIRNEKKQVQAKRRRSMTNQLSALYLHLIEIRFALLEEPVFYFGLTTQRNPR